MNTVVAVLLKNHVNADEFARHAEYTIENLSEILDIVAARQSD